MSLSATSSTPLSDSFGNRIRNKNKGLNSVEGYTRNKVGNRAQYNVAREIVRVDGFVTM